MPLIYEPVSVNMPAVWLVLMIILLVIEGVVPGAGVHLVCSGSPGRSALRHRWGTPLAPDSLVFADLRGQPYPHPASG